MTCLESPAGPHTDIQGHQRGRLCGQEAGGRGENSGPGGRATGGGGHQREHLRAPAPPPTQMPGEDNGEAREDIVQSKV